MCKRNLFRVVVLRHETFIFKTMYAALLGMAAGAASSIFGGIKANQQAKRAEAQLEEQRRMNENLYRRRYNEDPTQTAEAQSAVRRAREEAQRLLREARGVNTVMGGTNESIARAQEAGSKLISDTLGNVANNGTARKDAIEDRYLRGDNNFAQQYINLYNQRAQNATTAANEGVKAGMGLVGADLSAQLQTGKGLFGDQLKKYKVGGLEIPGGKMEGVYF